MALSDSKIKLNFEEEILYRVLIFVTPLLFDPRNLFGSTSEQSNCPSRDFSFIWAPFSSPIALCHTSFVAQNFLKEPNRNMSPKERQLIDYNTRLLVVEIMLFLVGLYWQLKNLMNRSWLQLFDYWHLIQVFLQQNDAVLIFLMEKPLMLLCYLLSSVTSPTSVVNWKVPSTKVFLLADSASVKNDSLCCEKFIERFWCY